MMPLAMVAPGEEVRLTAIRGGRRLRKRLADLGLNLGMTVRVVQRDRHGPLILAVKDARLALGRGMAHKIMVELT
jgi:Fe2+ transport system protein FeoA